MRVSINEQEVDSIAKAVNLALQIEGSVVEVKDSIYLGDQLVLALLKLQFPKTRIRLYKSELTVELARYLLTNIKLYSTPLVTEPTSPQLVFSGCSFTVGFGVSSADSYSAIVSTKLPKKHSVNLARNGNSIITAIDVCYNLSASEVLIVGLSSPIRALVFSPRHKEQSVNFVVPSWFTVKGIPVVDYLRSRDYFSKTQEKINDLVRWANSRTTLILADFLWRCPVNHYGYIDLSDLIVDRGSDSIGPGTGHPGPLTHKIYAEKIYQKLIELRPDLLD